MLNEAEAMAPTCNRRNNAPGLAPLGADRGSPFAGEDGMIHG